MALDTVKELGRDLRRSTRDLEHVKRRVGERFGVVEKSRDVFSNNRPFVTEFVVDGNDRRISLDLQFFQAPVTDQVILAGTGILIDDGKISSTDTGGTFPPGPTGNPGPIIYPPAPPPSPIPGPAPNPENSEILSADDFKFTTNAYPGNVYKVTETVTVTKVGFYAEASPTFFVSAVKSDAGGDVTANFFEGFSQGNYINNGPGWHLADITPITFNPGDIAVFRFTNGTHDPVVYHDTAVYNYPFATYLGCNRYQWDGSEITTGTWGQDPDGTHGMQPSTPGKKIPEYAMMLGINGAPPVGFTQLEEWAKPDTIYIQGDPGYEVMRNFKTLYHYKTGTLRVWINGLRQMVTSDLIPVVDAQVEEDFDGQRFALTQDTPSINMTWERVMVSYVVGDS
jgi:hypothetical protein